MSHSTTEGDGNQNPDVIERKVIDVIVERLHIDYRAQVTPDARLYDLTDSLGLTEIVMDLEDEFEGSIPDETADEIQTVGQLIDHVKTHLASVKTGP